MNVVATHQHACPVVARHECVRPKAARQRANLLKILPVHGNHRAPGEGCRGDGEGSHLERWGNQERRLLRRKGLTVERNFDVHGAAAKAYPRFITRQYVGPARRKTSNAGQSAHRCRRHYTRPAYPPGRASSRVLRSILTFCTRGVQVVACKCR